MTAWPLDALAEVCARYDVASLDLFGSRARGDARPGSDVDLVPRDGLKARIRDRVLGEARALYAA